MTTQAVDTGGTKIAVGMVNEDGRVLSRGEFPSDADRYASGLDLIASMLRQTARNAGTEISGIGIGSTEPLNLFSGGWRS